jgi:hypothetical protein
LELSAKPAKPRTVGFLKQDGTQHKKIWVFSCFVVFTQEFRSVT